MWHSVVDILAVYLVLLWCGGSRLSVVLTWIITMVMQLLCCLCTNFAFFCSYIWGTGGLL